MTKPRFLVLTGGAVALALFMTQAGCSKASEMDASDHRSAVGADAYSEFNKPNPAQAPLHAASRQQGAERSVVKSGTLSVEVDSLEKAEKAMRSAVVEKGGYIYHEEGDNLASTEPSLHVVIRIPEKTFDDSMAGFIALGRRTQQSVQASDNTEEILDTEARLKQLQQAQSAHSARRISTAHGSVDSEVAHLLAEKATMQAQAAMSSIDLTLYQKPNAEVAASAHANWGSDAWNAALSSATNAFRVIGAATIWLVVFSPIWGFVLAVGLWIRKAQRLNSPNIPPTPIGDVMNPS
jgi:hypothetical protein